MLLITFAAATVATALTFTARARGWFERTEVADVTPAPSNVVRHAKFGESCPECVLLDSDGRPASRLNTEEHARAHGFGGAS